ncbi:NAD(+) diphosphatase [Phocaeicola plebeius]|uniref:NAD(+) diphosphatase n=1 Tax=Phocaeicola plebeius TaxID=310297 RepID=UPI003A9313BC
MKQDKKELCGWFIFCPKQQLLLVKDGDRFHIPYSVEPPVQLPADTPIHTVGEIQGHPAKACALSLEALTEQDTSFIPTDLRASYDVLPLEEYQCAGKASQILTWDKNSRFCPACGTPTIQTGPITKRCPHCGQEIYPRISPAVIVLIKKEDSVLLVHARNFRGSFKGLVAGFLEPGETLEECVHREVMEETGIRIKNLKYFGSQPWPYPSGIMVGYYAEYESGTIKLQDEELSAGAFYHRDHLPEIPKKLSIARKLIDAWLNNEI